MEQDTVVYKISMPKCLNFITYFSRRLGTWLVLTVHCEFSTIFNEGMIPKIKFPAHNYNGYIIPTWSMYIISIYKHNTMFTIFLVWSATLSAVLVDQAITHLTQNTLTDEPPEMVS